MRLFLALPIPGLAGAELERVLEQLRRAGWPVRWVAAEGLHLTLKFFGETAPERVGEVVAMLDGAVARTPAIACAPRELGAFPTLERARVLWAGYEAEPALELLVHRVEQGAEALGFAVEGRPFRPHVTLGRVREGQRLPATAAEVLEAMPLREGFVAERAVLYQSFTGAGGSRYVALETFSLGA